LTKMGTMTLFAQFRNNHIRSCKKERDDARKEKTLTHKGTVSVQLTED
jgi:hypothetical protein